MKNGALTGQAAIVTGATRGIGRAIAKALVGEGVDVALCGRDATEAERTAVELSARGPGRAIGAACDVTDMKSVARFVARSASDLGRLDILVNNAGIGIFASVPDMDPDDFRRVIETNILGVFHMCHAAIPAIRATGGGFIVNISSLAGTNAFATGAAYNASKFGLNGFSEALMHDVRHDGIRVAYVMPGSVATEFAGNDPEGGSDWKLHPEDVADVVLGLLTSDPRALPSRVELRPSRPKK
jgi:NAD(P)-dependent dehydrogenase (short-subunit alcohol dehydrogenase family)